MPLSEIVGQPIAVRCLRGLISRQRLPHALLFHGPEGVGKRTTALALAQALNCPEQVGGDACGHCAVCRRIAAGIDVDTRLFAPVKNDFLRDQAVALREEAFMSPNTCAKKILILDAAHRITTEAANLLLKVLEEPPETTVFVLLTDNPHRLLPTIRSRTMAVPFRPLDIEEAAVALDNRVPAHALPLLHVVADGNLGRIIAMSQERDLEILQTDIKALLENVLMQTGNTISPTHAAERIQTLAERLHAGGEDDTPAAAKRKAVIAVLETMLSLLELRLRDAMRKAADPGPTVLARLMEILIATVRMIEGSGHPLLALEVLFMNMRGTLVAVRGS